MRVPLWGDELTVATTTAVHVFLTQIRCSPQPSAALPTLLVGQCAETGPRVSCPLQGWQQRWSKMERFQRRSTSKGLWSILCGCGQVTTPCVEFFWNSWKSNQRLARVLTFYFCSKHFQCHRTIWSLNSQHVEFYRAPASTRTSLFWWVFYFVVFYKNIRNDRERQCFSTQSCRSPFFRSMIM